MRVTKNTRIWMLAAALAAWGLVGCGGGGGGSAGAPAESASPPGRVAILLTDAPSDAFDAIYVTVRQVLLLGEESQSLVAEFPGAGRTYNLLELRDSAELMMDPAVVAAGCYDKIRLVVSGVELVRYQRDADGAVAVDGDGAPLPAAGFPAHARLPGNGKIDLNPRGTFCVVGGETLVLQLDMDADNCIHVVEKKHGTEYNFRPVVFVTVAGAGDGVMGKPVRLSGRVTGEVGTRGFTLCEARLEPLARPAEAPGCTDVVLGTETSLFDLDGLPVQLSADAPLDTVVFDGDYLRVVGRYTVLAARGAADGDDPWDDRDLTLRRFQAELVEVGTSPQSWGRYAGEILDGGMSFSGACEGTFRMLLDPGQGVSRNLEIAVHLYGASRVLDREGTPLTCRDLAPGARAVVDAVISLSDDAVPVDVLNAALVVTGVEPATRIDGTLTRVGPEGRTLAVRPDGAAEGEAVCVELAPRVVPWLYRPANGDDAAAFEEVTLGQEHVGYAVSVAGEWVEGEACFTAGGVIVTAPEPGT